MTADRKVQLIAWLATAGVVIMTVAHWASIRLVDGELGRYELFPLFGLLAWTLMWFHYTIGPVKHRLKASDGSLKGYFAITSGIVLGLILLHPGLFVINLWLDGFGPPPFSYLALYPELLPRIALLLGTLSLITFLAFEFHRKFKDRKWWRYVEYANIVAMFAIFFHALTLGAEIAGWFQVLWVIYAIVLAFAIGYNYYYKQRENVHA